MTEPRAFRGLIQCALRSKFHEGSVRRMPGANDRIVRREPPGCVDICSDEIEPRLRHVPVADEREEVVDGALGIGVCEIGIASDLGARSAFGAIGNIATSPRLDPERTCGRSDGFKYSVLVRRCNQQRTSRVYNISSVDVTTFRARHKQRATAFAAAPWLLGTGRREPAIPSMHS
jgi:hypothetical protein